MSKFTRSSESDSKEDLEARGRRRCPGNILGHLRERKDFIPYGYNLSLFDIAPNLHFLVSVALLVEALWGSSKCLRTIRHCARTYISILVSFNQEITNLGIRVYGSFIPVQYHNVTLKYLDLLGTLTYCIIIS
jgi:hypothetical protein